MAEIRAVQISVPDEPVGVGGKAAALVRGCRLAQANAANLEQVLPGVTAEIRAMDLVRDDFSHQAHILFCLTLLFRCQFHDALAASSPQHLLAGAKHLPAGVLPQISDVWPGTVAPAGSLPANGKPPAWSSAAGVELIEVMVSLPAEGTQVPIGQRPQGVVVPGCTRT